MASTAEAAGAAAIHVDGVLMKRNWPELSALTRTHRLSRRESKPMLYLTTSRRAKQARPVLIPR
jgi:hypothetical protein